MTADRVRWAIAYLRWQGDRFLTERYAVARLAICIALFIVLAPMLKEGEQPPGQVRAVAEWIIYIAILIVSAIISIALAPKPKTPERQKAQVPVAVDGKSIIRIYGEVWVDDAMVLGFKTMGEDPIKKKGGKK